MPAATTGPPSPVALGRGPVAPGHHDDTSGRYPVSKRKPPSQWRKVENPPPQEEKARALVFVGEAAEDGAGAWSARGPCLAGRPGRAFLFPFFRTRPPVGLGRGSQAGQEAVHAPGKHVIVVASYHVTGRGHVHVLGAGDQRQ